MLRGQLQTIKRGARTVAEYVQEVKSISDSLASINERVVEYDIVMYVLNGLGREYDNFVTSQWIDYSTVECQICKRIGHSAGRCPYRYTASKNNGSQKKSQVNTSPRNPQANSSIQVDNFFFFYPKYLPDFITQ